MSNLDELLAAIDHRRIENDDPCDSCDATGLADGEVCGHCLGQKVLLTGEEFETLLLVGMRKNDGILGEQEFEY